VYLHSQRLLCAMTGQHSGTGTAVWNSVVVELAARRTSEKPSKEARSLLGNAGYLLTLPTDRTFAYAYSPAYFLNSALLVWNRIFTRSRGAMAVFAYRGLSAKGRGSCAAACSPCSLRCRQQRHL
jgi:hypothetical protein